MFFSRLSRLGLPFARAFDPRSRGFRSRPRSIRRSLCRNRRNHLACVRRTLCVYAQSRKFRKGKFPACSLAFLAPGRAQIGLDSPIIPNLLGRKRFITHWNDCDALLMHQTAQSFHVSSRLPQFTGPLPKFPTGTAHLPRRVARAGRTSNAAFRPAHDGNLAAGL